MRVAIVHDELLRRGGAEQVVLTLLKAFPNADLYTSSYNAELTYSDFKNYSIKTSWFNVFARNERWLKRLFFPLGIIGMKMLEVKGYDIVIISNTNSAKYVSVCPSSKVFIYTYTPFRLAWNPTSYQEYNASTGIRRVVFDFVIGLLKKIDKAESRKGNFFLGMTTETAQRIRDAYEVEQVEIIPPPVKCKNFFISSEISNYYLVVSRLEFYKKVDLAIEAFNKLGLKLIIIGKGSKKDQLMKISSPNIEFKDSLSNEELAKLYANCKALIFPQHEDYGIAPLEANASGRPVLAYAKGGVLETMVPYSGNPKECTAFFFNEQTVDSLIDTVRLFETVEVNPKYIREHASKFDEEIFVKKILRYVDENGKQTLGYSA